MLGVLNSLKHHIQDWSHLLHQRLLRWTKPSTRSVLSGTLTDLTRTRAELLAENALLRQQLLILCRQVQRPMCTRKDRILLVLLARATRRWKEALLIVQPNTLPKWHRHLFRWYWRKRSKPASRKPKLEARNGHFDHNHGSGQSPVGCGTHLRGAAGSSGIQVSKRTIQKYMRKPGVHPASQTWVTFLRTHAQDIWTCDFLPIPDLFFRALFAFFLIELKSRKVVHVAVTRHPTDAWVAQQLREATPYGHAPRFLIRDNDSKFGPLFAQVASGTGIKVLRTPYHAPRANAYCERFLGSVRGECLDHLLILREQQLFRVLQAYIAYFNRARPHQGLHQQIPDPLAAALPTTTRDGPILVMHVLGGLHHDYRRAA